MTESDLPRKAGSGLVNVGEVLRVVESTGVRQEDEEKVNSLKGAENRPQAEADDGKSGDLQHTTW